MNEIENPESHPCKCGNLIFDKVALQIDGEKLKYSKNDPRKRYAYRRKLKVDSYLIPYQKSSSHKLSI